MAHLDPPQPGGRMREIATTAIATVVIVGFVTLVAVTALQASGKEYANLKDLLIFVNPLVGVVVGFYFTKATLEPRAEQAETAARVATNEATTARQVASEAQDARGTAEVDAEHARYQARDATVAAEAVADAADQVLRASAGPPVLGGARQGAAAAGPELDALRQAVAMARRLTADTGAE
jgi:hypothetical protein